MTLYSQQVDLTHWSLNLRAEGNFKIWEQVGSSYVPSLFVEGFGSHQETKERVDPYFRTFLQQRYQAMDEIRNLVLQKTLPSAVERDVYKVHKTWRWGKPARTSGPRNIMRFRMPITDPEVDIWSTVESWAGQHFRHMDDSKIDWDYEYCMRNLNQQSSPGLPHSRGYKSAPPFSKKCDYFNYEDGKHARENFSDYCRMITSELYIPCVLYTCAVKKELRKCSKIDKDEYRAYCAACVENSMAGNAITFDMNQKFYAAWHSSASFVGGSTFGGCWHQLFERLNKHPNATEMDVSAWDATLGQFLIESLSRVMWNFVRWQDRTPYNKVRWNNLFKEIYTCVIVCPNGDLFFKEQGNPSGSFLTIVTNTIIHYMLFCYAWLKLAPPNMRNYIQFHKHVELALCGDDSLMTTSDEVKSWFNMKNITAIWQSLGIKAKVEATGEGKLIDRQFLSQRTYCWRGTYVPYPDYDKVVSSMLWHTKAHLHVRWSYLKACALRMNSFFNPELQLLFRDYIRHLEQQYKTELHSDSRRTREDPFSWEEVFTVFKTDADIMHMYTTAESQPAISNLPDLKSYINSCLHECDETQEDQEDQDAADCC